MKFHVAIARKNTLEGGANTLTRFDWDNDGGGTKGGITQNAYDAYRDRYGKPRKDISEMDEVERDGITFHEYWMPTGAQMPAGIDFMSFQFGFVTYPTTANRKLQEIMKRYGLYSGNIDGIMGPKMLAGLTGLSKDNIKCLLNEYAVAQKKHFQKVDEADGVVGDDPVKGWHNRVDRALAMSLEDLENA